MQEVILTRGLPASGKSTWARAQTNFKRINRDDLRSMVDNGIWSKENEKLIVSFRNTLLVKALQAGHNVIIDDTNLPSHNFKDVCGIVSTLNLDVKVTEKVFKIDTKTAIERDSHRIFSVGAAVINGMYQTFIKGKELPERTQVFFKGDPTVSNPNKPIINQNINLPKAIICDLDGTLAIMGDRSPYDASQCDVLDSPNHAVVETVKMYHQNGYSIVFVSAREFKDREPTLRFIDKVCPELQSNYVLYMRQDGDKRKDTVVKKEIWDTIIRWKYNVFLAIDDRPCVVRMWRREVGIPVLQVNDIEF